MAPLRLLFQVGAGRKPSKGETQWNPMFLYLGTQWPVDRLRIKEMTTAGQHGVLMLTEIWTLEHVYQLYLEPHVLCDSLLKTSRKLIIIERISKVYGLQERFLF